MEFLFGAFKKVIVCILVTPSVFGMIASIMLCVAGGVGLISIPFKPLTVVAIIVGAIFLILCIAVFITGIMFFKGLEEKYSYFMRFFVVLRLIYGIVWIVAFLSVIILAVGNFSLRTSLKVVFAREADELEGYLISKEDLNDPLEWISKTSNSMKSVGVVFVIAFVFLLFSGGALLSSGGKSVFAKVINTIFYATDQLICGLIVFLPLAVFGREGLAVFGFKAVKDGSFTGMFVLSILMMAFAAVTIVLILVSVKVKPVKYVTQVFGLIGFGISIALIVFAGTVLSQRKKAPTNFDAFCFLPVPGTDGAASPPVPTAACTDLFGTYRSNMCTALYDEANTAAFRGCVDDAYSLDGFVEEFVAATKSWMGWMGFAVMFVAIYYLCFSCGICLPEMNIDDEKVSPYDE